MHLIDFCFFCTQRLVILRIDISQCCVGFFQLCWVFQKPSIEVFRFNVWVVCFAEDKFVRCFFSCSCAVSYETVVCFRSVGGLVVFVFSVKFPCVENVTFL